MKIQRDGDKVTALLDPHIGTYEAQAFAAEIEKAVEGTKDLTLDCQELEYISSSGLRAVMLAVKTMGRQGEMRIVNVRESVYEVLEMTGFTGICDVEMLK